MYFSFIFDLFCKGGGFSLNHGRDIRDCFIGFFGRRRVNTSTLEHYLPVSGYSSKPNILTFPERHAFGTLLLLLIYSSAQQKRTGFIHYLSTAMESRRAHEHPRRWTELPATTGRHDVWSGVRRASVQHQTRTKHWWRNIYQPWPEGRFTFPVVPPCLKDDTVYTDCLKLTENK